MKIVHCCLACFYIDNYGYQENILPKVHKIQGHDVAIVASTENYLSDKTLGYSKAESYINEHGIPVTRLPYVSWLPSFICKKLRIYKGLFKKLQELNPDVIFLHDIQFIDVIEIIKYAKKNPKVKIYADGHTDFINSGRNWISKNILHKIIYRWCAKKIEPYTEVFFGVTPLRAQFFEEVYGINKNKIDLLFLGYDDTVSLEETRAEIRKNIRSNYDINENDFLIVTGGKITEHKKIHELINAFKELNLANTKLLVFGDPTPDMKNLIDNLRDCNNVIYVGWVDHLRIRDFLIASDVAFYPGTHSVLWEQTVGLGIPAVFKKWDGMEHVDLGGNCIMLNEGDIAEIRSVISSIVSNRALVSEMAHIAASKGKEAFSYSSIAKKAVGLD